jgi:hypothetical protein
VSISIKLELMGQPMLAEHRQGTWRLFDFDSRGEPDPRPHLRSRLRH